jgi:hypothetical protein
MAKKKVKKTARKKTVRRSSVSANHRTISFIVGVVTLAILAFLFFHYTRDNNYRQVLIIPPSDSQTFSSE